ncbi:hypothetical protein ACFOKJ_03980 [Vogesella amnigena]|uniref:Lipocalin-like domain-containing protein n=1 Tax=Vogesella amnigena TaxID=1507449 RepID=A0ABV7TRE9_9NEIS
MNKIYSALLLVSLASLLGACSTPQSPEQKQAALAQDRKWENTLVGTWEVHKDEQGIKLVGRTTYQPDGNFIKTGHIEYNEMILPITGRGTWQLVNGKLTESFTEDMPPIFKSGQQLHSQIIQIDLQQFVYKSSSGSITREIRVN